MGLTGHRSLADLVPVQLTEVDQVGDEAWPFLSWACLAPKSPDGQRSRGYPQPVLGLRALGGLARCGGHGAAHDARLRQPAHPAGEAYPEAEVVRVVLDNLNTHRRASLYETFPAEEARRIARRLEFHYTPKHGSWLNMAEIEFSVLSRSCLKQRLSGEEALRREVDALVKERNAARATINWRFNTRDARTKLHRLYPSDFTVD